MSWLKEDFVLSAVSQSCWGPHSIGSLDEFQHAADTWDTEYLVAVSPFLKYILKDVGFNSAREHESIPAGFESRLVSIVSEPPVELYQSHAKRPTYYVDYKNRFEHFAEVIRSNWDNINQIYDIAFRNYNEAGIPIQHSIDHEVENRFWSCMHPDDFELRGMITGYLKQVPRSLDIAFDIEPVNQEDPGHIFRDPLHYFYRMWPVIDLLENRLLELGDGEGVQLEGTGKGVQLKGRIPIKEPGYELEGINYAFLNMAAEGGFLQPELIDKLVTVNPGSRKLYPAPLLMQRAYQGMWKAMFAFYLEHMPEMEFARWQAGYDYPISITDNIHYGLSLDMACATKIVTMNVHGICGQGYKPTQLGYDRDYEIIRSMIGMNGRHFYPSIEAMCMARTERDTQAGHLMRNGVWPPNATKLAEGLVKVLKNSRVKHEIFSQTERPIDPDYVNWLRTTHFAAIRGIGGVDDVLNNNSAMLNPGALDWLYQRMHDCGMSIMDMRTATYARYCDIIKDGYSKACWSTWPEILRGMHCRG